MMKTMMMVVVVTDDECDKKQPMSPRSRIKNKRFQQTHLCGHPQLRSTPSECLEKQALQ